MKGYFFLLSIFFLFACGNNGGVLQHDGDYTITLRIDDSTWLPTNVNFHNGRVDFNDVYPDEVWFASVEDDSIVLKHKAFDSELKFAWSGDEFNGYWYNKARGNYKMELRGRKINLGEKFKSVECEEEIIGDWQTAFGYKDGQESYPAIASFKSNDNGFVRGTFRTETGDYGYLFGTFEGNHLILSTFDGAHAFLFTADLIGDSLVGQFYSGKHWSTDWIAYRSDSLILGNPYELTKQDTIFDLDELHFESIENQTVHRLADPMYEDKAVMIQIMGTWCPNCYDETRYYNQLYAEYAKDGLEILAVCFESPEKTEAKKRISKFKKSVGVDYSMVYGGKLAKTNASAAFPFLNEVISYPTTLFFNRRHELVKIHTGFNGPGTEQVYRDYKKEMQRFILTLLK